MSATTTTATTSPLSDADQAWLDATPFGDRREITRDGATFAVDRRFVQAAPTAPVVQPWSPPPDPWASAERYDGTASEHMHNPWPRYAPPVDRYIYGAHGTAIVVKQEID